MQQKSINLCMIVKDEAHCIVRCLDSVKRVIDKALIVDTGSSDNTIQVINDWLEENEVEGKVIKEPWKDFGYNRSFALQAAKELGCDYSLMIDADEIYRYAINFDVVSFKCSLKYDYYNVPTKTSAAFYYRPTLTSNHKDFKYKAVVHEYLEPPDGATRDSLDHNITFWNEPIQDSARNQDPQKFQKDALALEKALKDEKDEFLISRYTYYLAQCYKDCQINDKALENFQKRIKRGGWGEELYVSHLYCGEVMERLNSSGAEILDSYALAQEQNPNRAEAIHHAARYCRTHGRNQLAYAWAKQGMKKNLNENFLFAQMWIYDYGMLDEFSIAAYWAGEYQESFEAAEKLLKNPKLPPNQIPRVMQNLSYARDKIN